jgi:Holliday junction resolvase RusA-like endonuclease
MISYTPEKTVTAEQAVADAFRAAVPGYAYRPDAAYVVEAVFHNGTRRHRDVDNMLKLILDGLNGVAWADDWQVVRVVADKLYAPGAARSEVWVYDMPIAA